MPAVYQEMIAAGDALLGPYKIPECNETNQDYNITFSINFIYGPDNRFGHFRTSDCLSIQNVSVGYFPMYNPNPYCYSNRNTNT